jgi:filamentous hemagglutinin
MGGRWHLQKARDYAVALQRWLESHPTANDFDRAAAQAVLDDLTDATKEVPFP